MQKLKLFGVMPFN